MKLALLEFFFLELNILIISATLKSLYIKAKNLLRNAINNHATLATNKRSVSSFSHCLAWHGWPANVCSLGNSQLL